MGSVNMATPFKKVEDSPPSVFKEMSEEINAANKEKELKIAAGHKSSPRFSSENMRKWIDDGKKTKKSSICALLVGDPKIGKSGIALDCRTEQQKNDNEKVIVFELNSDQGTNLNKATFHKEDDNIVVLNPREYSKDEEGEWMPDYILTMSRIKSAIRMIKEDINNGDKIVAIVLDGLDIFLNEICEGQTRINEEIDAAGGLGIRFYKNRNAYYYNILNLLFDLDVDKYLITHYASRTRDSNTGIWNDRRTVSKLNENLVYAAQKSTSDKVHQIIEFTDKTRIVNGKRQVKIIATIVADRRSLETYMKEIVIAETGSDGKVQWYGQNILNK